MNANGIVFDIKRYSLHDGPGIRSTVFLKGCPLSCRWCHNPESRSPFSEDIGVPKSNRAFYTVGEDGVLRLGRKMDLCEVMEEVCRDTLFYDESGGGVTFSGGEPLSQPEFLMALLRESAEREIHTVLDTSGFAESDVLAEAAPFVKLFHYDIKLMDDTDHINHTGVSNKKILNNLEFLVKDGCRIRIRIVVIPGITDTERNLNRIAEFLLELRREWCISLLPYNRLGNEKYKKLGKENRMPATAVPSEMDIERIRLFFTEKGFYVGEGALYA